MRSDIKYAMMFLFIASQCMHSTSPSSAVSGQLKQSHDTQGTNLSISDVQKTLYKPVITHNMRYIYKYMTDSHLHVDFSAEITPKLFYITLHVLHYNNQNNSNR